jgi:transcriptional regulator with XRE-family HTH domain
MHHEFSGERLRKLRKKARLTQDQVVELTGVAETTLYHLEHDHRRPYSRTLQKLVNLYQMRISYWKNLDGTLIDGYCYIIGNVKEMAMAEISLAKQLSGPEAMDSLLQELRQKLRMNGRFSSHMAYPGYRAVIKLEFYPAASFIPPLEQDFELGTVPTGAVLSQTATVVEEITIPVRPPNAVREHAEMPTPVLTQDENGNPVEKWVHKKGKVPKNKYKGGDVSEGSEPMVTMVPTAIPVR